MDTDQEKLKDILTQANEAYRLTGDDSGLTDSEYDYLLDLVQDDSFKNKIGVELINPKAIPAAARVLQKDKNSKIQSQFFLMLGDLFY